MHLGQVLKNRVTRNAIIYTLFILAVYSIGKFITSPGINPEYVKTLTGSTKEGLLGIYDLFGGGALSQMSLFALGVGPYITASIVIQLLETDLVPAMTDWKHQGVEGENKRNKWTKITAIVLSYVQAIVIILTFKVSTPIMTVGSPYNVALVTIGIATGVLILMWLGDRITEKGIGNGISVIIMGGILASVPGALVQVYDSYFSKTAAATQDVLLKNIALWGIIFVIQLILVLVVVYFSLAKRKIRINYVRSSRGKDNEQSYLPIKINPAGVIPVIFVTPMMELPALILNYVPMFNSNGVGNIETIVRAMFDYRGTSNEYWYLGMLVYFLMILGFSVLYSYIQMNPENIAESLERQNAYIVGVRSGEETEKYISNAVLRTSFWGGIMLGFIAITPTLITHFAGVQGSIMTLLGTGLIITVNVLVQSYESLVTKTQKSSYRVLFGENKWTL
ncbi:MAG: preprotein translocase subunit SecY [Mycoplasmatales bacterium]